MGRFGQKTLSGGVLVSFLFKYFFVFLSGKILDRIFILLHHCFYLLFKSQIHTKQTGLTIRFVIPQKISATAFKNSKTITIVVQMLLFFVSLCITHSLVERMAALTALAIWEALGTKKRNSEDL